MKLPSIITIICLVLLSTPIILAQQNYVYHIDLQNVVDDQVKVVLTPPKIKEHKATFILPSVIPGSYARKDYGRFVVKFKAFDANNTILPTKRKGDNLICIKKAHTLHKIEYWVDDTWDHHDANSWVFEPGGSNIEADKNFSINHHAFFGYFEGYKNLNFELHFSKPEQMYGSCPLEKKSVDTQTDIFYAPNYVDLVDSPLMYSLPDTTNFMVKNTAVHVAVYSPNNLVTSKQITEYLQPLSNALGNFFGTMPVDRYYFLFYFADPNAPRPQTKGLGGFGALEHSYSSFYYLPEMDYLPALQGMIQDVAGHEFLHILTPLNIHSEEIEDFNFVKPTMSEHLWLYEGVTEYFAQLIQLRDGIIDEDAFKNKMREKIVQADKFKPLSFTKMSTKVVKDKYQDHYLNVYQKGALIGFALDLKLTELSKGKYGLRELMLDLSAKYGPNKPFKDEELIDEIINITGYTELRPFFKEYVYGKNRIPYQEYFTTIGWQYLAEENSEGYSFGDFAIGFNPETKEFMFVEVKDNVFSIENQDILYAIEGTQIDHDNLRELIGTHIFGKSNLEPVQLTVIRDGKEVSLNGTPKVSKQTRAHVIKVDENATDTQLKYRSFLFYGK